MPPGAVDHDPYMSFIDSDKFSPIQSVSGEEIDEDDSLDQQKAKILFDETQNAALNENHIQGDDDAHIQNGPITDLVESIQPEQDAQNPTQEEEEMH